ncbi:uncharacterized protein G2W53_022489 [Senna tora]|uniref:Uncharacterized protein n=1 Tax=Senna tora TaxID=362788 RepID=A0A834WI69_9FABA|nr:uncharacterized protein G2W53_022489 [Senna tora]
MDSQTVYQLVVDSVTKFANLGQRLEANVAHTATVEAKLDQIMALLAQGADQMEPSNREKGRISGPRDPKILRRIGIAEEVGKPMEKVSRKIEALGLQGKEGLN